MIRTFALILLALTNALAFADDNIRELIEARNKEWTDAANRGDVQAVVAIYDEGFLAIPPTSEPITDRAELEAAFGAILESGMRDLHFETISLKVVGDHAYEIGRSTSQVRAEDGKWVDTGDDYLVVWKKDEQGVWNYHIDIWWPTDSPSF
jgi:ketosteroid isomerase-like protein